jgi:hypothetical protein
MQVLSWSFQSDSDFEPVRALSTFFGRILTDSASVDVFQQMSEREVERLVSVLNRFIEDSTITEAAFCDNLCGLIARVRQLRLQGGGYDSDSIFNPFKRPVGSNYQAEDFSMQRYRAFCILESILNMKLDFDPGDCDRHISDAFSQQFTEDDEFVKRSRAKALNCLCLSIELPIREFRDPLIVSILLRIVLPNLAEFGSGRAKLVDEAKAHPENIEILLRVLIIIARHRYEALSPGRIPRAHRTRIEGIYHDQIQQIFELTFDILCHQKMDARQNLAGPKTLAIKFWYRLAQTESAMTITHRQNYVAGAIPLLSDRLISALSGTLSGIATKCLLAFVQIESRTIMGKLEIAFRAMVRSPSASNRH